MGKGNFTSKSNTICWHCRKATTSGCSWSKNFIPVDGWKAIKCLQRDKKGGRSIISYNVLYCPEFIRG